MLFGPALGGTRRGGRECDEETTPAPEAADHAQLSAQRCRQTPGNGQPEAGPLPVRPERCRRAEERGKDLRKVVGGYSLALIGDSEAGGAVRVRQRNRDRATGGAVPASVVQQDVE